MSDKIRTYPSITPTTDDILNKLGKKSSTALEEFACWRATNNELLVIEEQMLKRKEKELLEDKETIEERLEKVRDELTAIKDLKKSCNPINSQEFRETVEIVSQMLQATKNQIKAGKWNVERTELEDIGRICRKRNMPIEAVLSEIPAELKQYLKEYGR